MNNETQKTEATFQTFQEFWPFYLSQHTKPLNRKLHLMGSFLSLLLLLYLILNDRMHLFLFVPFVAYGHAWVGHFFIEKNRPATFKYPFWSLRGDFKMISLMVLRKL